MTAVQLVGSINLPDIRAVFESVNEELGGEVTRIPDGEVGRMFVAWFMPAVLSSPGVFADDGGPLPGVVPRLRIRDDFTGPLALNELGIAKAAIDSYKLFAQLKQEGVIPEATRFQVGIPSPITVASLAKESDQERFYEGLTSAVERELATLADGIPHEDLAVQLELPGEVAVLEGVFPSRIGTDIASVAEEVRRLSAGVPAGVEVGVHLCYGDPPPAEGERGRHFIEPDDLGLLVRMANAILADAERPLAWIHMPVPIARDDERFFAPLADLELPAATQLFLGLVHDRDGLDGSRRRIAAARKFSQDFGVATECGMGRVPTEVIPDLLRLHRETVEELGSVEV